MRLRRRPEIIVGRVNTDGSIAAGDGFSVVKTGTGTYTITFPSSFRLIAAVGTPAFGAVNRAVDMVPSGNTVAVTYFATTTSAATDGPFNFIAQGAA
jgi:hypothetical protein